MTVKSDIRADVAEALSGVVAHSYAYRPTILKKNLFPAAMVSIEAGDSEPVGRSRYDITATLTIELIAMGHGDLESDLDAIEVQVNQIMEDYTAVSDQLTSCTRVGFAYSPDPETASMVLALTFLITYED